MEKNKISHSLKFCLQKVSQIDIWLTSQFTNNFFLYLYSILLSITETIFSIIFSLLLLKFIVLSPSMVNNNTDINETTKKKAATMV